MALWSAATAAAGSGDGVPLAGRPEAPRRGLEPHLGFRKGTNPTLSKQLPETGELIDNQQRLLTRPNVANCRFPRAKPDFRIHEDSAIWPGRGLFVLLLRVSGRPERQSAAGFPGGDNGRSDVGAEADC
jgi:hypothetical protein